MIYDLTTAWYHLRSRPVLTLLPMLVMGLALALSVTVLTLGNSARQSIIQASDPFGALVVGPKGDSQQLVLNTILLQGLPLGTIPYTIYEDLAQDQRVRLAVPLAEGDNIGGARVIGTDASFFELRTSANQPPAFQIAEGRVFEDHFEIVLGSRAAETLGLRLGDTFRAAHGVTPGLDDDVHEQIYTVVGILQPSNTPYDNAAITPVESIWESHHEEEGETLGGIDESFVIGGDEAEGEEEIEDRLTAVLVQATGFVEQNQLWQEFYTGTEAQAVFPGQQLGGLFDLLRQGEQILTWVGYLVFAIAVLTIFLAVYSATLQRERDLAIMRSLGAGRTSVMRVVLAEALLIALGGAVLGRIIGYAAAAFIGKVISQQYVLPFRIDYLTTLEPALWLLPVLAAALASIVPAALAYRVDVVEKLAG
jgi:putative ABC transport system permease protein